MDDTGKEEPRRSTKEILEEKERECLYAIKQDLCAWLSKLLSIDIKPDSFLVQLDTGVLLCSVVSLIQQQTKELKDNATKVTRIPLKEVQCNHKAKSDSFHARDNTANFISWCRAVGIEESILFESNGLVLRNDERRVILSVLEVARIAYSVGLAGPKLVELENEIESLENENTPPSTTTDGETEDEVPEKKVGEPPKQKKRRRDSLDSKVLMLFNQCTCKNKLQVISHGCGKFEVTLPSKRKMTIYVRILSDRILVRVGGGWDSIEHFILKYDPCRQGISVVAPSFAQDIKSLAPEVKVLPRSSSVKIRPQRKVKQLSPYATPRRSIRKQDDNGVLKCSSTPILSQQKSQKKRKIHN